MRVIPDGIERVVTDTKLLLKEGSAQTTVELSCDIPNTVDPSTVSTQMTFVGDLLGDSLNNIGNLLKLPSGCGEQNLARFATTVYVHNYLSSSGQLTDDVHSKIYEYVRQGLVKHLTLRTPEGCYKFFFVNEGSTWLTAFSIKIFLEALKFYPIDQNLIDDAFSCLLTKQEPDGGFNEDPRSKNYIHQNGFSGEVTNTAYIAILLTESLTDFPQYRNARDKAINYVLQNMDYTNAYLLAKACQMLHLSNHESFSPNYNKLLTMATETNEIMYWNVQAGAVLNVETAAYALLFMHKIDMARSIKLARYLVSKKLANGGWASTQDTVLALESLALVSGLFTVYDGTLNLLSWPDAQDSFPVTINTQNMLTLQSFDLDQDVRHVTVFGRGPSAGKAIISFTCRYYENDDGIPPRFKVEYEFLNKCNTPLNMKICINYIPDGADDRSNMVIMKMNMPSGYIFDSDTPSSPVIRVSSIAALTNFIRFHCS